MSQITYCPFGPNCSSENKNHKTCDHSVNFCRYCLLGNCDPSRKKNGMTHVTIINRDESTIVYHDDDDHDKEYEILMDNYNHFLKVMKQSKENKASANHDRSVKADEKKEKGAQPRKNRSEDRANKGVHYKKTPHHGNTHDGNRAAAEHVKKPYVPSSTHASSSDVDPFDDLEKLQKEIDDLLNMDKNSPTYRTKVRDCILERERLSAKICSIFDAIQDNINYQPSQHKNKF